MLPSASVGSLGPGLFEPITYKASERIEKAVLDTLNRGFRTADIYSAGTKLVGCKQMTEEIMKSVESQVPAPV
ncbi:hypothetical protein K1719_018772 [Acacia pycnantha]|nr:hypothetical protein K1719_018772 [Acacia pycnantha]